MKVPPLKPQRDTAPKLVTFTLPETVKRGRGMMPLVRSDNLVAMVQIFTDGNGEKNLHSHDALDGFWFVLAGRARFYGADDMVIGEAGPHQAVFVPKEAPYWFEQVGDDPLHILQLEAIDTARPNKTRMHRPPTEVSFERLGEDGRGLGEVSVMPDMEQTSSL